MTAQYCKVQSMRCMEKERVNCATEQDSMRTKTLKVLLRECLKPPFHVQEQLWLDKQGSMAYEGNSIVNNFFTQFEVLKIVE